MRRFHGTHFWTMDGPPDTDVDEIMCFAIFTKEGDTMGVCLVQTWCTGGWEIYVPPSSNGGLDETEAAIRWLHGMKSVRQPWEGDEPDMDTDDGIPYRERPDRISRSEENYETRMDDLGESPDF
jgi:hypothetical protein